MEKYNVQKLDISNLDDILDVLNDYPTPILSKVSIILDLKNTDSEYYGIILDNILVGFIGIAKKYDHADIIAIAVKKNMTRKKIASKLLEFIINICISYNYDNMFLEVRMSNIPAITLYELFNFKKISERKNYYTDNNEDAYIYKLDLK